MFPRRITRTQQPNQHINIDWSNPICRGLKKVWILNSLVPNQIIAPYLKGTTTDGVVAANKYGKHLDFGTGTDGYLNTNLSTEDFKPTEITITSRCRVNAGSNGNYIINANYNGSTVPFSLSGYNLGSTTRGMAFFDGSAWHSTPQSDIRGQGWTMISGVYTSAAVSDNLRLFHNGTLDNSADVTGNPSLPTHSSSYQDIHIGRYPNDSTAFDGDIEFVFIHDRALSAIEIKSLHDNPYQIFQPRTQLLPLTVTAAGGFQPAWARNTNQIIGMNQ